jgi:hypothetical protein
LIQMEQGKIVSMPLTQIGHNNCVNAIDTNEFLARQ